MESKSIFVRALIRAAGGFTKDNVVQDLQIEEKTRSDDLVTNLDRTTRELLVTKTKQAYPDDNIVVEGSNIHHPISDGNAWVLDPIDGTVNFVIQEANSAVVIAYYKNSRRQFGLTYDVANDILYSGGEQLGVYANDKQLTPYQDVAPKRTLTDCNASIFSCSYCGVRGLIDQTLGVRVYGETGFSMAYVMTE